MKSNLTNWEKETDELAQYFEERYFGKVDCDSYWIGDEIGDVYSIGDYYFTLDDMVQFIRHGYEKDMMFEYYDFALDYHSQDEHEETDYLINIKNYKKLNK